MMKVQLRFLNGDMYSEVFRGGYAAGKCIALLGWCWAMGSVLEGRSSTHRCRSSRGIIDTSQFFTEFYETHML